MTAVRLCVASVVLLAFATPARSQEVVDHPADTAIQSTVIVNKTVATDGKTTKDKAGLTVNGRVETGAERARRDAVDGLEIGTALGVPYTPETAAKTTVVVTGTVTQQGSRKSQACTQVGAIGVQSECRPQKP